MLATIAAVRTDSLLEAGVAAPEALTSGFSWLFLGAAVASIAGAIVAGIWAKRQA